MTNQNTYDQQINFLRYMQIKNYTFLGDYKTNPLIPLYPNNMNSIFFPNESMTKPESSICTKLIYSIDDKKPVNCIQFFNSGKKLVYGTTNGSLVICEVLNSFSLNRTIQLKESPSTPSIRAMEFNNDESFLLVGDNNGNLTYCKKLLNNFELKKPIQLHSDTITDLSFSINSSKFVSSSDDRTLKIVDFITQKNEFMFKEHLSFVKTCDWNPIKNIIVSGGKDQLILLWDPRDGDIINKLHLHRSTINRIRFNKNGNWFLSGSIDHSVKVTDIRMMKEMQVFKGHELKVNTVCWHPVHQDIFCSAGEDKKIIFYKLGEDKNYIIDKAHDKEIYSLCFNQIGTLLASGGNDFNLKFWIRDPLNY